MKIPQGVMCELGACHEFELRATVVVDFSVIRKSSLCKNLKSFLCYFNEMIVFLNTIYLYEEFFFPENKKLKRSCCLYRRTIKGENLEVVIHLLSGIA